jgi:hypothetical protein
VNSDSIQQLMKRIEIRKELLQNALEISKKGGTPSWFVWAFVSKVAGLVWCASHALFFIMTSYGADRQTSHQTRQHATWQS